MKRLLFMLILSWYILNSYAGEYNVSAPSGNIYVVCATRPQSLSLKINLDKQKFFSVNNIALRISNNNSNENLRVLQVLKENTVEYNGLLLRFTNKLAWEIRVFDNGVAYRWIANFPDSIKVLDETMLLNFDAVDTVFFPQEKSLISHYERKYLKITLADIKDGSFASLPVLVKSSAGLCLISEADLYRYPGMFLQKKDSVLSALFPAFPLELRPKLPRTDRDQKVVRQANYIARINGDRTLPWRVFIIAAQDKDLLANDLISKLSRPNWQVWDFSWVKPGKVAWDWWNARQLEGVDFKPGINTKTYKYYIDFAAKYGLEYVIFDEGWSRTTWDLLHFRPDMDVKYLIEYAKSKEVGIILWTLWGPLNKNMTTVMDSFAAWGAAGIKVDFMQRTDQPMVEFYERTAREAAKRHLVVDFHGAFKPSGLRRAYPNVLSYEGVMGAEHNKWSKRITPTHNVTLPFIRNVVGPMDYTPGGMRNVTAKQFSISWKHPRVMGTRANQVAMYVIYYSPLQMLADSPTEYEKNDETTRFIARIPTVWDQTIPLAGKVGEYVAIARRHGQKWYIGVMNGEHTRKLSISLNFLPTGRKYKMEFFADTTLSADQPTKYRTGTMIVNRNSIIDINMSWGGGYAAILTPIP